MRRPVRIAPVIVLIVALPVIAAAQQIETKKQRPRSLEVLDPDDTKEFPLKNLTRNGQETNTFRTRGAKVDSFYFQQKFQPKGYETKNFRSKGFWGGDFKFSTNEARTKTYDTKTVNALKEADVREAQFATKTAATREFIPGNKVSPMKGRSQYQIDKEGPASAANIKGWTGNGLDPLTVQDIKELLNKNK